MGSQTRLNAVVSEIPAAPVAPARSQIRPCLIVNPRSFRSSRGKLAARAVRLANAYGADVLQADQRSQVHAGLDTILARGQRRLFVLAGDGTVQAIVDRLATLPAGTPLPQLLVLGGGRTNLTAADLDGCGDVLKKLEAAFRHCQGDAAFEVEDRHTLTIEQAPAPPRRGFFVAAGFVDSAIRAARHHRDSGRGAMRTGHLSTAWYLLKLAVLSVLGRSPLVCPDLDIDAPGCGRLRGPNRVLIATTLHHRGRLFNPYAERGEGVVRINAVAQRAPFWRALPRLLTGKFTQRMNPQAGYLSGRCEGLTVHGVSGYSLDGEEFDTDPARPVVIRVGPRIGFLKP